MATPEQLRMSLEQYAQRGFGKPKVAEGMLERWLSDVNRLQQDNDALIQQRAVIMRNSDLSNEGRQKALTKLANEAVKKLSWVGEKRNRTIDAQARLRTLCLDYMTRPKGADAMMGYFREREIRDSLRTGSQQDREIAFLKAAERLDAETMRALLDRPGGSLVEGNIRSRGEEQYGARRNPEAWANLHDLDIYLDHLHGVIGHAAHVLLDMGADPAVVKETLAEESVKQVAHA